MPYQGPSYIFEYNKVWKVLGVEEDGGVRSVLALFNVCRMMPNFLRRVRRYALREQTLSLGKLLFKSHTRFR